MVGTRTQGPLSGCGTTGKLLLLCASIRSCLKWGQRQPLPDRTVLRVKRVNSYEVLGQGPPCSWHSRAVGCHHCPRVPSILR